MKKVSLIVVGLLFCSAIYAQNYGETKSSLGFSDVATVREAPAGDNCSVISKKGTAATVTKCTETKADAKAQPKAKPDNDGKKIVVTYTVCDNANKNKCYQFSDYNKAPKQSAKSNIESR